ncbi:MAG: glycosyltransferase family 1 protein [Patescibacteria group bacterium]
MIIGVDGNDANVTEQVGVSVYTRNLLEYFQKVADKERQFTVFLRQPPVSILPKETEFFKYQVVKAKIFWSQIFLPLSLYFKNKVNVFFSPAHYSPRFCPVPTVVTIHDLAYFYYPDEFLKKDLFKLQKWTKYSIEKAKKVIAVSKTTKKDLTKFYNLSDSKITVVYNGYEKTLLKDKLQPRFPLITYDLKPQQYILYVGTLQPRKNIQVLIQAFKKFYAKNPTFRLMLVGKKGWLYEHIFEEVTLLNLENAVTFTGYIPDNEVTELYKHAYCYVLPSLYEGFGIPVLEAMSHSCPVISSFASSLSEVGGEAAIYFDPENVNGLVDDLESLKNEKLRDELIQKGQERIKLFSWEKCAKETLDVITSVRA